MPKSPQVKFREPKRVKRSPEDDFFYGFQGDDDLFIPREAAVTVNFVKINGIGFSLFDGPLCVQPNSSQANNQCDFCDFFTPQDCLLRYDEFLLEYIQRYADIRSKRLEATQRNKQEIHQTMHKELKAHGRPLHYTVIASMITDRYPEFKLNARSIYRIPQWHPELFTRVEVGVYQAK